MADLYKCDLCKCVYDERLPFQVVNGHVPAHFRYSGVGSFKEIEFCKRCLVELERVIASGEAERVFAGLRRQRWWALFSFWPAGCAWLFAVAAIGEWPRLGNVSAGLLALSLPLLLWGVWRDRNVGKNKKEREL